MFRRCVVWLACWACLVAVVHVGECKGPCLKGLARHQCSFRTDGRGEAKVLDSKRLQRLFGRQGWKKEHKRSSALRFFEVCCPGKVFYLTPPKLKPPCVNGLWQGECSWRAQGKGRLHVTKDSKIDRWEKKGWKVVKRRPRGGTFREVCCSGKVSYMKSPRSPKSTPGTTRGRARKSVERRPRSSRRKRVSGSKPAPVKKPAPRKKPAAGERIPAPRKKTDAQGKKISSPRKKLGSGKRKPAPRRKITAQGKKKSTPEKKLAPRKRKPTSRKTTTVEKKPPLGKKLTPLKTPAQRKKPPQKKRGQGKRPGEGKRGAPEMKQRQKLRNTTLPKNETASSTLPKNETRSKPLPKNDTVPTSPTALPKAEPPPSALPKNVTATTILPKTKTSLPQTAQPSSRRNESSEKPKTALPETSTRSKTERNLQPETRGKTNTGAGLTESLGSETAPKQGEKDVKAALTRLGRAKPFVEKKKEGYFGNSTEEFPEDLENAIEEFHEKFSKEVVWKKNLGELG